MLTVYTLEQGEKWDEIVCLFPEYDTYWLSGYVKAFKINGDGEPLLFFYEGNNVKGINVVMKRDIAEDKNFCDRLPKGQYFDFSTPYGYGGWIIEDIMHRGALINRIRYAMLKREFLLK